MIATQAADMVLPQSGPNGRARAAALAVAATVEARPTSLISYRSTGALVIVGPADAAVSAAKRLHPTLRCTLVIQDANDKGGAVDEIATLPADVAVMRDKVIQISGHLGQFAVIVSAPPPQGGINLLQKLGSPRTHFDLVLDLGAPPFIQDELLPFG